MKRQDIISIAITGFMGFLVGIYMYVMGFAGLVANYGIPTLTDSREDSGFVVVADAYGGCNMLNTCPTFRLDETGAYRYLYATGPNTGLVAQEGRLPYGLRKRMTDALEARSLRVQSEQVTPALCESFNDGIDVRYSITIDEVTYTLDSCGTAVDVDSELWRALSGVWEYLQVN